MEFQEIIKNRYSVRSFKKEQVSESDIAAILEAGRLAPTGCNKQPQRIHVIKSPEGLAHLKASTKCHFDAPLAMLVCCDESDCWHRGYDGASAGPVDASIVTTHMMLKAWEMGVGSCWVMHFDPDATKREFGLPDNEVPVAFLIMGYPSDDAKPIQMHFDSKDITELVKYE